MHQQIQHNTGIETQDRPKENDDGSIQPELSGCGLLDFEWWDTGCERVCFGFPERPKDGKKAKNNQFIAAFVTQIGFTGFVYGNPISVSIDSNIWPKFSPKRRKS